MKVVVLSILVCMKRTNTEHRSQGSEKPGGELRQMYIKI